MKIDILTIVPELLHSPFEYSILKRAQEKDIIEINIHNIRDYALNKHRQVDDYAFGGGAGMVMQIEPIEKTLEAIGFREGEDELIYMTPDGEQFKQGIANQLSGKERLIILCGHFKGVDQRVRDKYVTREISIGDFVLTGGELAAAVIVDSVVRLIPGVLSDETSALTDSFQDNLLAPPVYTRPAEYKGMKVPEILTSGNLKEIDNWRLEQSIERTKRLRPDLLKGK